jgi:hypothetical protein
LPLLTFTTRSEIQASLKNWLRLEVLVGLLSEQEFVYFMSAGSSWPFLDPCQELSFPDGHAAVLAFLVFFGAPQAAWPAPNQYALLVGCTRYQFDIIPELWGRPTTSPRCATYSWVNSAFKRAMSAS